MDRKIVPGWGKNPFREVIPPQQAGGYQIHFTRSGASSLCTHHTIDRKRER